MKEVSEIEKSAILSDCKKYRYALSRVWDEKKGMVMFIMLNPSTADGEEDDPTIRRCIKFAKDWGYGGILVGNLFAYRATDPKELESAGFPPGELNNDYLAYMMEASKKIVCAWGNYGGTIRDKLGFLDRELYHLGVNKDGSPKHPLYLKGNTNPIKWVKLAIHA